VSRYDNEKDLFKQYKATGDTKYKKELLKSLKNLVHNEVQKINRSGGVSMDTLFYKGLGLVNNNLDNWDPKKSNLNTYVTNSLKPLHRDMYKSTILHTPEHRIKSWQKIRSILPKYEEENGSVYYDVKKLSKMSGVEEDDIKSFLKENRKVYSTGRDATTNIGYKINVRVPNLDEIEKEFEHDTKLKPVWKVMYSDLKHDRTPSVTRIASKTHLARREATRRYNAIIDHLNSLLG